MYTLYGDIRSGSCIVELLMSELELQYTNKSVDIEKGEQLDANYQSLNPQGKIPCLVSPEGWAMTESVAILSYLLERHEDKGLLPPRGTIERYKTWRWLMFVATELYPIIEINDFPERFCGVGNEPEKTRETARQIWRKRWKIVESNIQRSPYLLGDNASVTDFYIAVVSRWAQQDQWRPKNIPKIEALTHAVSKRPKCSQVWQRHFA